MHELSITKDMLDLVLEQAEKEGAKEVGKINLVIGEMCGIVEDSVRFYFDFLKKDTIAEKATLYFTMIPTKAKCRKCGKIFELKEFEWTCPDCGGESLEIVGGKELRVESIEVE